MALTCKDEATKKFWIEFIQLYKEHPCLWDPTCLEYINKTHRDLAYNILLEKYWELDGKGTISRLKRRISTLRCGFLREYNKLLETQMTGNTPHVTRLWYFQLLKFIRPEVECNSDEEAKLQLDWDRDSKSSYSDRANEDDGLLQDLSDSNPETTTVSPVPTLLQPAQPTYEVLPIISTVSSLAEDENPSSVKSLSLTQAYQDLPVISTVSSLAEKENPSTSKGLASKRIYQGLPTLAEKENPSNSKSCGRAEIEEVENRLEDTEEDDSSAFATLVKTKMRRFDPAQRVIAQKLILDVMFMADMKQLQLSSSILNPASVPKEISNGKTKASRSHSSYVVDNDDDNRPLAKIKK